MKKVLIIKNKTIYYFDTLSQSIFFICSFFCKFAIIYLFINDIKDALHTCSQPIVKLSENFENFLRG